MTTFTSDDREEEYKKIVAAAPNQPGYEDAVPIPFAGWVNASPPHIVDSGASVMKMSPLELADHMEKYFDSEPYCDEVVTMLRQQQAEIERLKALCITYIDDEWSGTSSYQAKIDEVNNDRK